jgi:HlyD family secretion protein
MTSAGAGIGWLWWHQHQSRLPPGIASGNGRLESDEIDIDTKFAGRIAKLFVDEGDMVAAGQVVAMMDTRDLQASLKKSQALVSQAQRSLDEAKANLAQQQTQVTLAQQQLDRTSALVPKGFATVELLDQRRQQMNAAAAAQNAVTHKSPRRSTRSTQPHDVRTLSGSTSSTIHSSRRARGAISTVSPIWARSLPAGGKVLRCGYFVRLHGRLPADRCRPRSGLGSEARIVLDAYPAHVIPAKVVFIASQAQFTPKTVETKDERDKLMFRIRVQIDPGRAAGRAELVEAGCRGWHMRTDSAYSLAIKLQASAPPMMAAVTIARVAGVTHLYGKVAALDAVTLALPAEMHGGAHRF